MIVGGAQAVSPEARRALLEAGLSLDSDGNFSLPGGERPTFEHMVAQSPPLLGSRTLPPPPALAVLFSLSI